MKITWLGHSCFLLEEDGYRIALDPYTNVDGYPPLKISAHAVYCSHDHYDHSFREGVTLLPGVKNPFTVREIQSFHDDAGGKKRGGNTIRVFTAKGISVCHLGDLGHLLNAVQIAAIGRVDVLLVPVGGIFTIDAQQAKQVIRQLHPRCAVPMHYRHAPYGIADLNGVELFLELFCSGSVKTLPGPDFTVDPSLPEIVVPTWRNL